MKTIFILLVTGMFLFSVPAPGQNPSRSSTARLDSLRSLHPELHTERFSYADYCRRYPHQPFRHTLRSVRPAPQGRLARQTANPEPDIIPEEAVTKILIVAQTGLYEQHQALIDRYGDDIRRAYACEVVLVTVDGGTAVDLKDLILSHAHELTGVVGIGELPVCYFNYAHDSGYESDMDFICDYYFMDLDGEWIDQDNNGVFDDHRNGQGDVTPEIFFARIDPARASGLGDPDLLLERYFEKNHAYWSGAQPLGTRALAYVTEDWTMYGIGNRLSIYGPGSTDIMYQTAGPDNPVSAADFLANRIPNPVYSYVNQWIHSGSDAMAVYNNGAGTITALQIKAALPQAFVWNLMSCHSCEFVNHRHYCIGQAYVFNDRSGSRGLTCLGPTKSAGMCRQETYWEPWISRNYCMGQAFGIYMHQWNRDGERFEQTAIDWAYCVTIIGDPLVMLTGVPQMGGGTAVAAMPDAQMRQWSVTLTASANLVLSLPFGNGSAATATVNLYDLHGRTVFSHPRAPLADGTCSIALPATLQRVAGGLYLCRVEYAGQHFSGPVVVR